MHGSNSHSRRKHSASTNAPNDPAEGDGPIGWLRYWKPGSKASRILGGCLVLWLSSGVLAPFHAAAPHPILGPLAKLCVFGLYALPCALLVVFHRGALPHGAVAWFASVPALAIASTLWSDIPFTTLLTSVELAATVAFGAFFGLHFTLAQQLWILALPFTALALASAIAVFAVPELGVMEGFHSGAWQGVYYHKNQLGRDLALIVLLASLAFASERRWRLTSASAIALAIFVGIGSQSLNSQVVGALAPAGVAFLVWLRDRPVSTRRRSLTIVGCCAAALGACALVYADELLRVTPHHQTMNDRVGLWRMLPTYVAERPWLGWGYQGFWSILDGPRAEIHRALAWEAWHAHNGFLDLQLELGMLGLLLCVAPLPWLLRLAWRFGMGAPSPLALWPIAYFVFLLLFNIVESPLVIHRSTEWALVVAATATMIRVRPPDSTRELAAQPIDRAEPGA